MWDYGDQSDEWWNEAWRQNREHNRECLAEARKRLAETKPLEWWEEMKRSA